MVAEPFPNRPSPGAEGGDEAIRGHSRTRSRHFHPSSESELQEGPFLPGLPSGSRAVGSSSPRSFGREKANSEVSHTTPEAKHYGVLSSPSGTFHVAQVLESPAQGSPGTES